MKFLAVLAMVAVAVNGLPGLIPRDGGNDWEKWNEKTVTITKYETKTETKTVTTEKPVYTTVTATKEVTKEVKVPVKEYVTVTTIVYKEKECEKKDWQGW